MKSKLWKVVGYFLGISREGHALLSPHDNDTLKIERDLARREKYAMSVAERRAVRRVAAAPQTERAFARMQQIGARLDVMIRKFRQDYETWMGEQAPAGLLPQLVRDYDIKARAFKIGALGLVTLEIGIVMYLQADNYGLIATFFVACLLTAIFVAATHGVLRLIFNREHPKETFNLISKWVVPPSALITIAAILPVSSLRVISNEWLDGVLSPLVDIGFLGITLGLVPLAGALIVNAEIMGWSGRAADEYERLTSEMEAQKEIILRYKPYLDTDDFGGEGNGEPPLPNPPKRLPRFGRGTGMVPGVVLAAACLLSACGVSNDSVEIVQSAPVIREAEIQIIIDQSGSMEPVAQASALRALREQLPELVEAAHAVKIGVDNFATDGFSGANMRSLDLPQLATVQPQSLKPCTQKSDRAGRLEHIRKLRQEACRKATEEAQAQAQQTYRAALRQSLEGFGREALVAPVVPAKTRCTDLYGVLWRISAKQSARRQIFLILTDGYNSCKQNQPIPVPKEEAKALVLIAPAYAKEAGGMTSAEQFFARREALLKAAPWLEIVQAGQDNLARYLRQEVAAPATVAGRRTV